MPFYSQLPAEDRKELAGHIQVFMAEKIFEGCAGLEVTDEMKVIIAAQACLLLLHRDTDFYPELKSILVYPGSFAAPTVKPLGSDVVLRGSLEAGGQASPEGVVLLDWNSVYQGTLAPERGYNVVFHEFAHLLDYEDGWANGAPVLGTGQSRSKRKQQYAVWTRIMGEEFKELRAQVEDGQSSVLRPYGASNPAEFFAVATETFFCRPRELRLTHPELYAELKLFYQQEPAQWSLR